MAEYEADLDTTQKDMKTHNDRRSFQSREKRRPTLPESQSQLKRLRILSQWLLLIPVVMLILFSCGQIAILTSRELAGTDTRSNMAADYGPWSHVLIHSVKPGIIEDILRDKRHGGREDNIITEKADSDKPWLTAAPISTPMADVDPTSTFTPTPHDDVQTSPTKTILPQTTPTQAPISSPTPTPNQPRPTNTPSPIPTIASSPTNTPSPIPTIASSPTNAPLPSDSPTNTPTVSISNTYWFSAERVGDGYKLIPNMPNGPSTSGSFYLRFSTEPMPEGATLQSGRCYLSFYASNSSDDNWEIGFVVSVGTSSWPALGGTTVTIPANTTSPSLFTKSFTILSHTFSQGERLTLAISSSPFVSIHWDGEWNDAGLVVPPITP